MAIYDSNDKIQKWRYIVKSLKIIINGEETTIPNERVSSITIVDDYLEYLYPIFQIQMVLSSTTYYNIQKNKNNVQIFLRIDKYYYYDDKGAKADGNRQSCSKIWINDTFEIVMDEDTGNLNSALEKEEMKQDYTKVTKDHSDELDKVDNGVTFYLYKTLTKLKKNVNKVFTKANVTDAIVYLMTQANIKNVIMQQPDNVTLYDTFVIPPLSISKALYWIDTYYGLYKYGTIFFSDFDYFYIIPFDGSNRTAFIRGDEKYTYFVIPSSSSDHSSESGVLKKKSANGNYIIGNSKSVNISNSSISNDLIKGSDATVVDSFTGQSSTTASKTKTKSTATEKVTTNKTENSYYTSMQTAIANSLSTVIDFTAVDYDIDMIKPNKMFMMLFEDSEYTKKYMGGYIVSKCTHSFIKEGDSLMLQSQITVRKMK